MAAWWVYIVRCRDGSLYTGATNDVPLRVERHNAGKGARFTRSRRPVVLLFSRRYLTRNRAMSVEALVKRLSRLEKLAIVAGRQALPRPSMPARAARLTTAKVMKNKQRPRGN